MMPVDSDNPMEEIDSIGDSAGRPRRCPFLFFYASAGVPLCVIYYHQFVHHLLFISLFNLFACAVCSCR